MKIFCSSNPKNLAAKLAEYQLYATVEAEYGDDVVAGSTPALTLAHHGSRKENPNPCLRDNIPGGFLNMSTRPNDPAHDLFVPIEAIGLSHIDLDALGGTAALMGKKPAHESFWRLAAHIDSNGPHRAADFPLWAIPFGRKSKIAAISMKSLRRGLSIKNSGISLSNRRSFPARCQKKPSPNCIKKSKKRRRNFLLLKLKCIQLTCKIFMPKMAFKRSKKFIVP